MNMRTYLFFLLLYLNGANESYGQVPSFTVSSPHTMEPTLEKIYEDFNIANILTGRIYNLNYPRIEGTQYHTGDYLMPGDLIYDGILFQGIPIQYDIYKQLVIVIITTKITSKIISLDRIKVSEFSINGLRFITYEDSILVKGIYQALFKRGKSRLLVKRQKELSGGNLSTLKSYSFTSLDAYYVVNNRGSYRITGKRDFLEALDNDEKIKSFIRNNNLKFSKYRLEESLIKALTFYESL